MREKRSGLEGSIPPPDKQRRRVLIASPVGELGGAEQVVLALAERLPAHGIDVSFALLRPGPLQKIIENRGIRVHVFPEEYRYRNLMSVLRCARWLTQLIRDEDVDILHSNLTAHFVGGLAARRAKVPELWHHYDYPVNFDLLHTISRHMPAQFNVFITEHIKNGEPSLQRTEHRVVYPDCIDIDRLRNLPADRSVRERLGIGSSPFFLTVTRLQLHKGHAYLIDAAGQLAGKHPEVKWVIAGRPRGLEQEKYLSRLREQVAAKELQDRVLFVGFVRDEDLVPLYREALALVHPATSESYGLVLLEAMACELPVIAAGSSGPSEIIEDERNGLLVPVRNASALADAQERILIDQELGQRLRIQASKDVTARSVDRMVEEMVACYRWMMKSPAELQ